MPAAVALILAGFTLIYSALTGESLSDILSGKTLPRLNPAGGKGGSGGGQDGSVDPGAGSQPTGPGGQGAPDPQHEFKGPNAAKLRDLAVIAQQQFDLRISQICRPKNATYGAANSLHKQCRAFDSVGTVADRVAFARFAKGLPWVSQVFCDQAGMVAPGFDHSDHVHVGA
jgi:hypothetical protein